MDKIEQLEQQIRYHNSLYTEGNPVISDSDYDALVEELKRLNPTSPVLMEIGAVPSYGTKIAHKTPMGSLLKINTPEEIYKWYADHPEESLWSWKIDGCAGEIIYRKGKLEIASSRGDGFEGMVLTDNVKAIQSIPTVLDYPHDLVVRGEFFIPKPYFEENLKENFANARNCVASSLMLKDPSITADRGIEFLIYKIMESSWKNLEEEEAFIPSVVGKNGLNLAHLKFVEMHREVLNEQRIAELEHKRYSQIFEVDGIVVSVLDNAKREEYGYLNDRYPKGMIAYKFKPEETSTKIVGIEWNCGRTGKLVPVAVLEPVKLAGSVVSRCMLHNWKEIMRLDICRPNQEVVIQKSGDIIPQITRAEKFASVHELGDFEKPTKCPSCGTLVEDDGINLWCLNDDCNDKLIYRICNWFKILDVKEIGEGTITDLCKRNMIQKFSDVYFVEQDELAKVQGYGSRSADIFCSAVMSVTQVDLWKFLAAIGIPGIGVGTAKLLAKRYGSLQNIISNANMEDLVKIDGISDISAKEIMDGVQKNRELLSEMAGIIKIVDYETKEGIFKGKTFCCTGELSVKRKEVQKMIEERGGEYSSIKKSLNFLLIGDGAVQAKIDKAKKLGAEVIDEKKFREMLG